MAIHSHKLKKQINGSIYYGYIELSAQPIDSLVLNIEFDESVEFEWRSCIECGIRYFYHYYSYFERKGLSVSVKNLHTMLADTTPIIVLYVSIKCLSEMFSLPMEIMKLDEFGGGFVTLK